MALICALLERGGGFRVTFSGEGDLGPGGFRSPEEPDAEVCDDWGDCPLDQLPVELVLAVLGVSKELPAVVVAASGVRRPPELGV